MCLLDGQDDLFRTNLIEYGLGCRCVNVDQADGPVIDFNHLSNLEDRFHALIDTIFTLEWSKTVDPGVHFCFYYLSFRNTEIHLY